MSKYRVFVGINYEGSDKGSEVGPFNPDSPHQVGMTIAKIIEEDKDAINFVFTVTQDVGEDGDDVSDNTGKRKGAGVAKDNGS